MSSIIEKMPNINKKLMQNNDVDINKVEKNLSNHVLTNLYEAEIGSLQKNSESKLNNKLHFRKKEFKIRPSLLTSLYETESRVVYNFAVSLVALATLAILIRDFYKTGNPFDHFWLIYWNFVQLPQTMFCWTLMYIATVICVYYGMTLWTKLPCKTLSTLDYFIFYFAYAGFIFSLFYYPIRFVFNYKLRCACTFIITCENTRLAMKTHSFIRENFSRGLELKKKLALKEQKTPLNNFQNDFDWPTIQQFVYFTFCPSFLYRDSYLRVEKCNWWLFARYACQCAISIYILNVFVLLFAYPAYESLNYENGVEWKAIAFVAFQSIPAGAVTMLGVFYGLLHSWLNMFSEATRFGDRHFYSNWWMAKNMADYYRNWNLVVHEWLYTYIYQDITKTLGSKWGSKISQIVVFFLSAAFHEYWFSMSFRQFYPILFFMYFVLGGLFFKISLRFCHPQFWNTLMWFNLLLGTGIFYATYGPEWFARQRCQRVYKSDLIDFIIPRIWTCMRS